MKINIQIAFYECDTLLQCINFKLPGNTLSLKLNTLLKNATTIYQGFTQALFATIIFLLRLSLKCSWRSGEMLCKTTLKTSKTSRNGTIFWL